MNRESGLFGLVLLATVAGLAGVLAGEWYHARSVVYAGGAVVVGAIGVMTAAIARMDEPESTDASH